MEDPLNLVSTNGVLKAALIMRRSVDEGGYTHYCYNYATDQGDVEAPTLRLNRGDRLRLHVTDRIQQDDGEFAGTSVFHCHILLHEDLGMMHKILVKPR